ncbi:MAG TPA: SLC13 family permease [Fervidobacterium sp.]|mgnify:FL=1|nr:SLC13 family permease [Fervidobacterium sp.]HPC25441.1 SLC13 family permease [Fervidobacterium sp.]HQQ17590.1 SLC13 family permease [Fervidobacterium sp.]
MTIFILFIYTIAYAFIIFKPHISSVTTLLFGIVSILLLGEFNFENLPAIVDFNTLFILLGMMLTISILKKHGVFNEISERIVEFSKGNMILAILLIDVAIFLLSSLLDNVTTILIFIPILLYIADITDIDYKLLTINAIFFSNLGGMTTAIGDPPNIVIYAVSNLSFMSFIYNLMPIGFIVLVIQILVLNRNFKKITYRAQITESSMQKNNTWILYFIGFMFIVLLMALHEEVGLELGFITLVGALIMLFVEGTDFQSVISEVDWDTLFLITGLYMLNGALEKIEIFAPLINLFEPIKTSLLLAIIILWSSLLLTGFLSALPVTLLYVTIIKKLVSLGAPIDLYWALALGVGIGGNLTPVASMCNIVGSNVLKNYKKRTLTFSEFLSSMLKPVMLSGIISTAFLVFKYLL